MGLNEGQIAREQHLVKSDGLGWRLRSVDVGGDELRGEKWVDDAEERELPALKIARASAEGTEEECGGVGGGGDGGGGLWQSNSVVVSASRIDLEPSPSLASKEFTLTTAALQLIIRDCFVGIKAGFLAHEGHRPAVPLKQMMHLSNLTKHH